MTNETNAPRAAGALSTKLTVLVCSCDRYEDLWEPFFTLLTKYWPGLSCRVVLNTETKTYESGELRVDALHPSVPDAPYGRRMRECITHIDTPYTLLLLDDFFLRAPVDEARLSEIVRWMDDDRAIASVNFDWNTPRTKEPGAVTGFYRMPQYAMYKLNLQAGVWRTERLLHYWRDEDDPWRWELFVNYLTFESGDAFYAAEGEAASPVRYGLNKDAAWGVVAGKWAESDVAPLFAENGLEVDFAGRGVCAPELKPTLPGVNVPTLRYLVRRIGLRLAIGLVAFTAGKRLRRRLGLPLAYEYYPELLAARRVGR